MAGALALAFVAMLALTGCPAGAMFPGTGDDDTGDGDGGVPNDDAGLGDDGGRPGDDAGTCAPVARCGVTVGYTNAAATAVALHGDFSPTGWTTGVAMTRTGDRFEVTLDLADDQTVLYKFVVDGAWIPDPGNPQTSPDGFGGVNSVLRAECDACPEPTTLDWRDAVLYFVMIDRFANGDPGNDDPVGLEAAADFQGGDLAGLRATIEDGYFERLGVNALWITSPLDNADGSGRGTDDHVYSGYHGYWPSDLDAVESRIGDEDGLAAVVTAAHAHGLKVVIDYVMNHVHSESPLYDDNPGWFWPNDNGRGGDCICGAGCSWDDVDDRKRCWFTSYLPDFDFRNGDARRWSVDNAVAWAQRTGIDGFRLDAVKHIEDAWLTDLRSRLTAEVAADFYLVGETYTGDRDLIKYYVNPTTMLDGQFDFPLRAQILGVLLRRAGAMADLVGFLDSNQSFYGAGAVMSTFLGNHDVPRTIHLAEDQPLFGDWDGGKERAWTNRPGLPATASPFERVAVAYTLLMTIPGVPLIYYGDEYGMPGAGDPDNRRFMQWDGYSSHQVWLRDRIAALAKVRAEHVALRRGSRASLHVGGNVYVYEMRAPGDSVFVALNRGDEAAQAQGLPPGSYTDLISGATLTAPIAIPPRTGLVLQVN